ncbi:hypothetical protein SAMN05660461_1766 [Chitinophaga ginsengisegetis]|uniref:Uncharacterized protein n=1 Tax=Chitinophaga ginsengisegetis TaxID=393003 RepID=A0A1T5NIK7_9BACT|nr:hypothetical protein [Chitinophaga ginsengisegetis]SKD00291.1 hypothetical protein SAMN05660461_1766 [Chitinophaga ginsengisegetis]
MKKQANKKGATALLLVATLILVLLISGIPSAHKADKKHCTAITGVVKEIKAGPPGIIIHLKEDPRIYYISRKTNTSLSLKTLEHELTGKNIQLYTAQDWSPLDPFSTMKQVRRLQIGDTVIFTEF